jgi:hypothetical protein
MSIQLPPNSTGSVLDTNTPTVGKERQLVSLGDPATGAAQATVTALANNGASETGALVVKSPASWGVVHTPTSATQATASKTAGGSGVQHVASSISFSLAVDGSHAQTAIQVNLRDGATGAGTILWSMTVLKAAAEALTTFHASNLNLVGTANTAMTLEFSAAGVTGSVESVALTGYDI